MIEFSVPFDNECRRNGGEVAGVRFGGGGWRTRIPKEAGQARPQDGRLRLVNGMERETKEREEP